MQGRPVWLASVSLRNRTGIIPTKRWNGSQKAAAERALRLAVANVGDEERERCFRMCATLCVHRSLSDAEIAALPTDWDCQPPVDLAGAPVEVLWERGIPPSPSTRPCRSQRMVESGYLDGFGEPLVFPEACGACDTCAARSKIQAEALAAWEARDVKR